MKAKEFKKIRENSGLSVDKLAELLQVSTRTVRRYESGASPIFGAVSVVMQLLKEGVFEDYA